MTVTQVLYEIFAEAQIDGDLSVPEIWAGLAGEGVDTSNGVLSFFPLPSDGVNFTDGLTVDEYQVDVWNKNMYEAEAIKEQAIDILWSRAEIINGIGFIFKVTSDLGGFFEEGGSMWHYSFIVSVRYNKR